MATKAAVGTTAKVTDTHDRVSVRVRFQDAAVLEVAWNRGGKTLKLKPHDGDVAEGLSAVVDQVARQVLADDRQKGTIGSIVRTIAEQAEGSADAAALTEALKAVYGVPGRTRGDPSAPGTGTATKKGRGHRVEVAFPNGDRVDLTINGGSVGLQMVPDLASRSDELVSMVFAAKQARLHDDATIASRAAEAASRTHDIGSWSDAVRGSLFTAT